MATIGDVYKKWQTALWGFDTFGGTAEWRQALADGLRKVGEAVKEERGGLTTKQAAALPHETELGPKAESAFREFSVFCDKK